ncbi:membrane-anchored mycosin MYCP [Nocardioides zeae]|uniref:Membrane-anchored mycosin MYCP n=2 Tax=Nocardioides zeae TaxID=1457234 RepID=A0ACC6IJC1_9ACTN|nr:S8 family serine peptidase [Nocardioides zeae]MDQ1105833.1 membrane-anchored mycosin MYCP [Nocardioides zeae]MDR6174520.1 membrane-anchored mycosin MYCP [Nocardioides zeae]MDR6210592.1 membrane-anchored mycosin MYCP [Nocardioides zeae]
MIRRAVGRVVPALGLTAAATCVTLLPGVTAPAAAVECPAGPSQNGEPLGSDGTSPLATDLDYASLHRIARGEDVGVAVIDTGVAASDALPVEESVELRGTTATTESYHGTKVAGIIAGRGGGPGVGVAPAATIYAVQVADVNTDEGGQDGLVEPTVAGLAAGLQWVVANHAPRNIKVVNVSMTVDASQSPEVAALVEQLDALDVLVVAANLNVEGGDPPSLGNRPEEDPSDAVAYPAAYPSALSVAAMPELGAPASSWTRPSYATDVVAPSGGALTLLPEGACEVPASSSYAAAVVSGLAAVMFSSGNEWTAPQVRARIIATAGGVTDAPNAYGGAGVVQPVEALTRVLEVAPDGTVTTSTTLPGETVEARAPRAPEDHLGVSRSEFLWWGLLAGAALALALVVRPATSRWRRR